MIKKPKLRYIVLLVSLPLILACATTLPPAPAPASIGGVVPSPTAQPTGTPQITATEANTFTVIASVNIRDNTGKKVIGWAVAGDVKQGYCFEQWCWLADGTGKIWRGCTNQAGEMECKSE